MDLPTPNIPLLRKAVEWAEAEAAKTDGTGLWDQALYAFQQPCGTACCIAGFTVLTARPDAHLDANDNLFLDGREASFPDTARELLGLTRDEASVLFWSSNSIKTVREIAEQIAARVGERL